MEDSTGIICTILTLTSPSPPGYIRVIYYKLGYIVIVLPERNKNTFITQTITYFIIFMSLSFLLVIAFKRLLSAD